MRPTKPKSKPTYRVRFIYNGVKRTLILDKNKTLSEYMCSNVDRIVKYRQASMPLMPDLLDFLNNNLNIRQKLEEWGVIEASQGVKQTILNLLEQHTKEKLRITDKRKKEIIYPIQKMSKYCRAVYLDDLSLTKIEGYLCSLIDRGYSARTYNKHLQILKQFSTWLDVRGYNSIDLRGIKKLKESDDRRYERRVLPDDGIKKLFNNIKGKHHGLTYEERKIVYLLALEAGFRWNEIVTLTVGDIDIKEK